jgi:subtilisin family serine protease
MRLQKVSTSFFRVFAMLMVVTLAFSQLAGIAQAQEQPPEREKPTREKPVLDVVSLDGVENYYGRLGNVQGKLGIVIELEDTPSALVYAENQGKSSAQLAAVTRNQTSMILGKQTDLMQSLKQQGIKAQELYRTQKVFNGIWLKVDSADIQKLSKMAGIKAIYPMIPKEIDHTTSVPLIGAPEIWAGLGEYQGEGVKIGIIDTGVDYKHTMFGGTASSTFPTAKVVGGFDFAGDDYNANDDDSVPAPDPDPMDCNGHGSHVSGTAAGLGVLPDGSTFVEGVDDTYADLADLTPAEYIAKFRIGPGVAPKAELYGLRVFGCEGSTNLTEQAIEWAMDPNDDGDFSDHLDVINMSLGASYGSEYDTSAMASNNAALAGIVVVASAGNSGDVYYITGSPGTARYAISVANSADSGAVVSAFEVTATTTAAVLGTHSGTEAAFGPDLADGDVAGALVLGLDSVGTFGDGCQAITSPVSGKIALIDRGTCTFKTKVYNAQQAGAIGVLIANNAPGFPLTMGDDALIPTVTIPSMMTTLAVGNVLKTELGLGAVAVRLTADYRDAFVLVESSVEDTIVTSSSRGPARGGTRLKPDLAAPGDTIYSAATGTGDEGVSFGGTSMAAPHVAGMMALLKEIHPDWSVPELKALAMNTATHEIYTSIAKTVMNSPTRVGAGRVDAVAAAESQVIAYYEGDPGEVSLAFGQVQVVSSKIFTKNLVVENKGTTAAAYNVAFASRYQANPGLAFAVVNTNNSAIANPVTIPAGGQVVLKVVVQVDPAALTRGRDPGISISNRSYFSEGGGYVTLASTGSAPSLRVPVHIAARPASAMSVAESGLELPPFESGTVTLTPSGKAVDTANYWSLAYILELMDESANDPWSFGTNDAADLRYVGATSDYPYYAFDDSTMYFGVSTYGEWDTPNAVEFDIYIDVDEDGVDDYVVYNYNYAAISADTFVVWVCPLDDLDACDWWAFPNDTIGSPNGVHFNNDAMVLPVPFAYMGLEDGVNTDFDFYVVTFARDAAGAVDVSDLMSFDVENQSFYTVDEGWYEIPLWDDNAAYNPVFSIGYDKAAIEENGSTGLLILHLHNAVNTAEVVLLAPEVASVVRADVNPTAAQQVDFTVTFTQPVTGVDAGDFVLTSTGLSGASIVDVVGDFDVYTVTVDTGSLNGTVRLDVTDNDSIIDLKSTPLGGLGIGNGSYTMGEVYDVIKEVTFADVPATYWAWSFIERLYAAGITGGCGTSPLIYCPDNSVTREQMAVFLLKAKHGAGFVPPAATGLVFTDVPTTNIFAPWIETLAAEGITGGCGPQLYCPTETVTRAQMAVFLLKSKYGPAHTPPAATGVFTDVPTTNIFAPWVEQLAAEGITGGCAAGLYCPDGPVTRAQMAVLIVKAFNLP